MVQIQARVRRARIHVQAFKVQIQSRVRRARVHARAVSGPISSTNSESTSSRPGRLRFTFKHVFGEHEFTFRLFQVRIQARFRRARVYVRAVSGPNSSTALESTSSRTGCFRSEFKHEFGEHKFTYGLFQVQIQERVRRTRVHVRTV